jgi:serine/threonine protein phosphatase 1
LKQKIQIKESDKIILLGDYIDRGTQSKYVIDYIIDLREKGFDIVPLLGNHEALLLDANNNEELTSKWIQNGGSTTLKSFNITSLKDIEPKYIEFFKGLSYYFAFEEYLFVHAGFNDSEINPFVDKYSMIWLCKQTYENPLLMNKIIIHGHRPNPVEVCKDIVLSNKNVINLDTGCVYSNMTGYGTLTAVELNTRSLYFA